MLDADIPSEEDYLIDDESYVYSEEYSAVVFDESANDSFV